MSAGAGGGGGGGGGEAASPFGADAAAAAAAPPRHSSSSSVSAADVTRIQALCTAAWKGHAAPLLADANRPFVRFTGCVVDDTTHERMALFAVPTPGAAAAAAPPNADAAGGAPNNGGPATTTGATKAGGGGLHSHNNKPDVTFRVLPLKYVHGLDATNAAVVEAVGVRPLFYAAASGHRASVDALLSAYKALDADGSSAVSAAVADVKPHPDRPNEWNLTVDLAHATQYDAATIARCNGHDEVARLLEHPNARSCTDSRACAQDCTLM